MTPLDRVTEWLEAWQDLGLPGDVINKIHGERELRASDIREVVAGFRAAETLLHASGWRPTEGSGS